MDVHYEEIQCRGAIQRVRGMPFDWSLNPYQGCRHGCHYCYARRYHGFLELDAGRDFERVIFVKQNIETVLRRELRRPGWKSDQVAIGTATDPYQPIEGRYRLTRACLQAFREHHNPVGLVTKGTLVVRDLDLLTDLSKGPGASVCLSLTTLDRDLWSQLEPGTPPPSARLQAMARLVASGVRAGVLLAPVLPGLTDDWANLEAIVRAAADHGAQFLGTQVLYLRPGTREHFLDFLRSAYPGMLATYRRLYPGAYVPKRFDNRIQGLIADLKDDHGLVDTPSPPSRAIQQLTFL